jgi:hypothetical protein
LVRDLRGALPQVKERRGGPNPRAPEGENARAAGIFVLRQRKNPYFFVHGHKKTPIFRIKSW